MHVRFGSVSTSPLVWDDCNTPKADELAQGLDACNGWTFWHLETAKGLISIDAFRAEIRAEMAVAAA